MKKQLISQKYMKYQLKKEIMKHLILQKKGKNDKILKNKNPYDILKEKIKTRNYDNNKTRKNNDEKLEKML